MGGGDREEAGEREQWKVLGVEARRGREDRGSLESTCVQIGEEDGGRDRSGGPLADVGKDRRLASRFQTGDD